MSGERGNNDDGGSGNLLPTLATVTAKAMMMVAATMTTMARGVTMVRMTTAAMATEVVDLVL